jgi:hypothetical protein
MLYISSKFTDRFKIQTAYYGLGCLALLMPLASVCGPKGSFWFGFVNMAIAGAFNGTSTVAVFGIAGFLPFKFMGAIMFG